MTNVCSVCHAELRPGARFCPRCGTPAPAAYVAPEAALPGPRQIQIAGDELSLPELMHVVEAGVSWWRQRLEQGDAISRAQAARAVEELAQVLASLSAQLAQGRATVRITGRLPAPPLTGAACPRCGAENRDGARFCRTCGQDLGAAEPLRFAARTDIGRTRGGNQDTVLAEGLSGGALLLVADGMGGHAAGERASRIAADAARAVIRDGLRGKAPETDGAAQALLRAAIGRANAEVYAAAQADAAQHGMGTTLTIALVLAGRIHLASVGDSRCYLIGARGGWVQLTTDHSLVARLVDIGQITPEEARTHPQRNLLYRAVGTDPQVEPDVRSLGLPPGAALLLCSDGLYTHVREDAIGAAVNAAADLGAASVALIAAANADGGADNISVVLAR